MLQTKQKFVVFIGVVCVYSSSFSEKYLNFAISGKVIIYPSGRNRNFKCRIHLFYSDSLFWKWYPLKDLLKIDETSKSMENFEDNLLSV